MRSTSWAATVLLLCRVTLATNIEDSKWPVRSTNVTETVQWDHYSYIVNGQRLFLFGGEMHPFRLPVPEVWKDILEKMKAMGMNTVSYYSHWGVHESIPGSVDTATGARNIALLLEDARDIGIFVTPRPGPYINGELNAGGLPLWMTTGEYGTLRSNGSTYTAAWEPYQSVMARLVAPFQVYRNGTVISYQIENELPNQWLDTSPKTPDPNHIAYMEELEQNARVGGIGVPFTHNSPNNDWSWSVDWDTVGAGGDVDIHGFDSYPLCWSCNSSQCQSSHPQWTLLDYVSYFDTYSPYQPSYMPEFQGGKVVPLTGYPDGCADTVGPEYRNLYYRHNIDQRLTAIMSYMLYGGTSAGWLAVPFLGTSYDYSAPIAEDRSLRDSFYELKNLALFTRVAYDLRMTDRLVSGTNYTTNSSVLTTILRNPATGAGFYIVRHDDSTDSTQITFKIEVDTSLGNLTIPAHAPGMSLSGHNAKILVTDFDIGGHSSIIYSTAEVLTYSIMDGETTLVLWTPTGETGEAYITGASNGKLLTGPAKVKFHQADKGVIIGFTQSADMMIAQVGNVKILLVDQKVAHSIFVPALSPDPHVPVNDTVIVSGPYLVRGASIHSNIIYITGDTINSTQVEAFAPRSVEKITWNGKVLDTTKTSYGSLKASISGPVKYTLPEFGPWKVRDSLPEVLMSYPDTSLAWVDANHTSTHNDKTGTVPYLYADDYGFHTGSFIYRGRFNGTASGLNVTVYGGEAAGYSIYLNGKFITAYLGSSSNSGSSVVDFESDMFVASGPNVLAIVADTSGHDEGSGATSVRGIYKIHLINSTESGFTSWKLAGTAGGALGTYLDPIRGAYNEAGWQAERLGWHLPGYDDSLWAESNPSDGFKNATVRFYRTNVSLNVPEGHDASVVFSLENLGPNSAVRALLYVNGYQYGRFNPYVNTATEFPVPPGILNYNGDNIIGLLVWAQSTEGAAVSVNWSISELRESSFNANIDAKYLQPQWNSSRLEYA